MRNQIHKNVDHVIDSSSDSSDSEPKLPSRRRKSSGSPSTEKKIRFPDSASAAQSYGPGQTTFGSRYTVSPGSTPRNSVSNPKPSVISRPTATPNQNPLQHSISSPLPPIHTSNAPNPYAPSGPYSPGAPPPPYPASTPGSYSSRYAPLQAQRMPIPPRPGSQDGKARSPSRLSHHSSHSRSLPVTEEQKRAATAAKAKSSKNFRMGATTGILGAGAIATFLEALEGLDI